MLKTIIKRNNTPNINTSVIKRTSFIFLRVNIRPTITAAKHTVVITDIIKYISISLICRKIYVYINWI